jgi:DNA-directed RNA polymerase specialized sigma24 family protein
MSDPTGLAMREHSHKFDVEAFEALERRAITAHTAFEQDVVDQALNDLLNHPDRSAQGKRLADNLRRTAWKKLVNRESNRPLSFDGSVPGRPLVPFVHDLDAARSAAGAVESAVNALPDRERKALFLDLRHVPHQEAGRRLGVSDRQYRNLAAAARDALNQDQDAAEAFADLAELFRRQPSVATQSLAPAFERWGLVA